jgi:signal transduction histidine kinase
MENIHLLLVDDEADFRAAISRRMERRGIRVFQAEDGPSCLDLLEEMEINVVVLDVKMPGMSGIEVLKRVKERHAKIEVILLTGQASALDGVEGIKAGAFDYLTKPIEFEHLFEKVRQASDRILREAEKQRDAEFRAKMAQQMITTERLASLGTLAVGVAHEINNPLAIIKESAGWMRQLLDRKELSDFSLRPAFEKAIGKIETGVDRTRRITHQLLGFVKRENSAATAVNLSELVGEAVELVRREVLKKEIDIVKKIDTAHTEIRSDPYQLRQVLINLLSNAIHATPPGGRITVTVEDWDDSVVIKIQDTGTGIPRENLDKIFEPFFSTKKPGEGTGLGLYVSRGIVEKLGGGIQVESQLGQGAVFSIRLPKDHPVETQLLAGNGMDIFTDTITSRE